MGRPRKNPQTDINAFCHRHRVLELEKGLDCKHVIIDFADWHELQKLQYNFICAICGKHPKGAFNFLSTFTVQGRREKSNWICDECRNVLNEHKVKNPY